MQKVSDHSPLISQKPFNHKTEIEKHFVSAKHTPPFIWLFLTDKKNFSRVTSSQQKQENPKFMRVMVITSVITNRPCVLYVMIFGFLSIHLYMPFTFTHLIVKLLVFKKAIMPQVYIKHNSIFWNYYFHDLLLHYLCIYVHKKQPICPFDGNILLPFYYSVLFPFTYTNENSHWFSAGFYDKKIYFMDFIQCLFLTHCFVSHWSHSVMYT